MPYFHGIGDDHSVGYFYTERIGYAYADYISDPDCKCDANEFNHGYADRIHDGYGFTDYLSHTNRDS